MKSRWSSGLALGGVFWVMACIVPVVPVALGQPPLAATQDSSRLEIIYVTPNTGRRIGLGVPLFTLVGTLPRMEVEIRNTTRSERRYEYLVEWFGMDGSKTQTISMWHSLYLQPNERQTIRSVGQVPQAYRARLTIRETSRRPS